MQQTLRAPQSHHGLENGWEVVGYSIWGPGLEARNGGLAYQPLGNGAQVPTWTREA